MPNKKEPTTDIINMGRGIKQLEKEGDFDFVFQVPYYKMNDDLENDFSKKEMVIVASIDEDVVAGIMIDGKYGGIKSVFFDDNSPDNYSSYHQNELPLDDNQNEDNIVVDDNN